MSERHPHSDLDHLDSASIQMLMSRYYSGERVQSLITEFNLGCGLGEVWRLFPPSTVPDQRCPACNGQLVVRKVSRSRLSLNNEPAQCITCNHMMTPSCRCAHCNNERAATFSREATKVRAAVDRFSLKHKALATSPLEPEQLSAESAIALLTLVRCGGWIDDSTIGPLSGSSVLYAPEIMIDTLITANLTIPGFVAPSPTSSLDAFRIDEDSIVGWSIQDVSWHLLLEMPVRFIERLEALMKEMKWPDDWKCGAEHLWRQLAVGECIEFAAYCLKQRRLHLPGALAMKQLFTNLLQTYSVSQCFQIIWVGAREVTDFLVRKQPNRQHASNYFIGACQRWADRAIAEKWNVKGFRRNYDLPRSQLSHVLHDVFLCHGEVGFTGAISFPKGA